MNPSLKWSALGILLMLILATTSIAGQACESDSVVLSDNSSITTVTEPSGYIQVEIRPDEIIGRIGQRVHVECTDLCPLIECSVTVISVDLALFDSYGNLLRKRMLDVDYVQGRLARHTTYRLAGDEASYRVLIVYDLGDFSGNPGTRYSEYTVAFVPIAITN